jgi:uncharacterized protein (TIGR03118 family)
MYFGRRRACASRLTLVAAFVLSVCATAGAQQYKQTNLVSDLPGADHQDANLVNPWGLTRGSLTPWWVSDNGAGVSTLYDGTGNPAALVVTIPPAAGGTMGVPTGAVFNGTTDFKLPNGNPAKFLFVAEDGTISGWNGGTMAVLKGTDKDAVYKGAAIATRGGANYLYVANFSEGRIDVFDTNFERVRSGHRFDRESSKELSRESFRDERVPRGFAPFNVQNIGGDLYVAFAKTDSAGHDEVQGAGLGYVDVFSPGGTLLRRFEHGAWLNAPCRWRLPTSARSATTCS